MRYWHPMSAEAAETLRRAEPLDDIVLLPLYPHFSYATTLSSLKEWQRVYGPTEGRAKVHTVGQFYDHPLYIQAVVQRIGSVLRQFPDSSGIHLVFSAHGLPMSLVEEGDPYPRRFDTFHRSPESFSPAGRRNGNGAGGATCCFLGEFLRRKRWMKRFHHRGRGDHRVATGERDYLQTGLRRQKNRGCAIIPGEISANDHH